MHPSPLKLSTQKGDAMANFVNDSRRVLYQIETDMDQPEDLARQGLLELAGPRQKIYFDPAHTHAGIVTCGGLCPGLNDVIRSLVMSLWHSYGVRQISGFQFGYRGMLPEFGLEPLSLTPDSVKGIHLDGGTAVVKIHTQQGIIGLTFVLICQDLVIKFSVPVFLTLIKLHYPPLGFTIILQLVKPAFPFLRCHLDKTEITIVIEIIHQMPCEKSYFFIP